MKTVTDLTLSALEEAYSQVFDETDEYHDFRLGFLKMVVGGTVPENGKRIKIENMLERVDQVNDPRVHAVYNSLHVVRQWYLNPSNVPVEEVTGAIEETDLGPHFGSLEKCLEVLAVARAKEKQGLLGEMDTALKSERKEAVVRTAQKLFYSGFPDLGDIAITMAAEYVTEGRYRCEFKELDRITTSA